jgi:hypothetical protein
MRGEEKRKEKKKIQFLGRCWKRITIHTGAKINETRIVIPAFTSN